MIPNPGSKEAIDVGCVCPILDNNFGAGIGKDKDGTTLFWYNSDCPIHGKLLTKDTKEDTNGTS
jgi:hypothetical protein